MKKLLLPITILGLAILFVGLGICQLVLYALPELDMMDEAMLQGATDEQISDYFWHQFLPQMLTYVINSFGVAAILFGIGMVYLKLISKKVTNELPLKDMPSSNTNVSEGLDDFFDEFETVGPENKI